jgi:hypothetical protein
LLLKHADSGLLTALSECAYNVYVNRNSLDPRLSKHKRKIINLANPRVSLTKKRKQLMTGGGFIVPLLASVISSLLPSLFNKK